MIYITVKQPPMYRQMTLEEFLFETEVKDTIINPNLTNTRTYAVDYVNPKFLKKIDTQKLIEKLVKFNEQTAELRTKPRKELYYEFHIPKKSGGLRKIDAPLPDLMDALRRLKTIFEEDFRALYHTSAFAYVKKRSPVIAIQRHQANESKWFAKYDLTNFFGSTTLDWTMDMFSTIFPFSEVVMYKSGYEALRTALELAFLDGGLPQGTPISPLITNIMMIPIDYKLANTFRDWENQRFVYTRYADDFQVSSKYDFNFRDVEKVIIDTLAEFNAPFSLNVKKTRYGSSAGSNWNLGVMLNKDNEITVGYRKKRQFQAMLSSYVMDRQNGKPWSKTDIQTMDGYRNYYRMVEGDNIDKMIEHIGQKFKVDIVQLIREDLKA